MKNNSHNEYIEIITMFLINQNVFEGFEKRKNIIFSLLIVVEHLNLALNMSFHLANIYMFCPLHSSTMCVCMVYGYLK